MSAVPWLDIPIVQAPVGSAAGAALCAAVSNAGALGGISLTWREPSTAAELVRKTRSLTDRLFYANFVLDFEARCLSAALDAGVPIVTFSWGDPGSHVREVRSAGARLGLQAVCATSARKMLEYEPDFLVVQGIEAGGHVQSRQPLEQVLAEVVGAAEDTPIFAAGGLSSGADLYRVMSQGAAGAVFGTRFVACAESEAHDSYKSGLVDANSGDTVLTHCFDIGWSGAAHRVIRNSTFIEWEKSGSPAESPRPGEDDVVATSASGAPILRYEDAMPRFDISGDWEAMCLYAGMSVDGIHSIPTAAQIVGDIWKEANRLNREL